MPKPIIDLLANTPLLTLFLVAGLGFVLGRIRVGGVSVGVAAVLFAGLGVGAVDPSIKVPEIVQTLGLVLFVYTLGLSSGSGFVAAFRKRGIPAAFLTLGTLMVAGGLWWAAHRSLGLPAEYVAGGFTGSLTNTAGLAAVLEHTPGDKTPAVAYAITYPTGVLGLLLVMMIFAAVFRWKGRLIPPARPGLANRTFRVESPEAAGLSLHELVGQHPISVVFGRVRRGSETFVAKSSVVLEVGDLISAVGTPENLDEAARVLGQIAPEQLELDRSEYDYRRIIISNPAVFGKSLAELQLPQNYGAIVTRVSRGDVEFLANGDTQLEPGDRVRVVTHRDTMPEINKVLGDSYKALSEIDILSFALGICIGLLVGMVTVPIGPGVDFRLGTAGGPLVVSLVLGTLHRTGPIYWGLSFNANLTIRQVGLVLFLAGVGVRSGDAFRQAIYTPEGVQVFVVGAAITMLTATIFLLAASRVFKVSGATLLGMVSAVHTQPAALGFATDQTKSDYVSVGYATIFPVASVLKIILAQVLLQVSR